MNGTTRPISVVPFEYDKHLTGTLAVIARVHEEDHTYPPTLRTGASSEAFARWLFSDQSALLSRWVAVAGGEVIGHVSATRAHRYIENFVAADEHGTWNDAALGEIAKLFVDPSAAGEGVGALLLLKANAEIISSARIPILAVISTSLSARRLYARAGMDELGSFTGSDGTNHVFTAPVPGVREGSVPQAHELAAQ